MGWENPPPVICLSGSDEYLREREVQRALKGARMTGRSVGRADGAFPGQLSSLLAGSVFFSEPQLIVVTNPEKLDPEFILEHFSAADNTVSLLLHVRGALSGNLKLAKTLKKGKITHGVFTAPKPWEAETSAVDFCLAEAKTQGKDLATPMAAALVKLSGTEKGILAYEVWKLCVRADADGSSAITPQYLKGLVSSVSESSVFPVVDAVGERNSKTLLKRLRSLDLTSPGDKTMFVCAILTSNILTWIQGLALTSQGFDPNTASQMMGMNSFRFNKSVLPPARRWGETGLLNLLGEVASVERAVKSGCLDPWIMLQSRLLQSCSKV